MKRLLVLLMVLLSICSAAFAEGVEDVLKDCKLDRNRWKVVEWFKAEKFVRFFDSKSVIVTGPEQFDVVIFDYYYDGACEKSSCKLQGKRHYHSEKWGFNTKASKGTLRSLVTKDADENVVESYDYPASMQVATDIKRNSIEGKVMQKAKEVAKNDKKFEPKEPVPPKDPNPSTNATPQKGFAPLPQPIGSTDGEWTYLGRFIGRGQNNISYVEYAMLMVPFNSPKEYDGVFDVYYYHKHTVDFSANNDNGGYCKVDQYGGHWGYSCILKLVPLDKNGNRIQRKGVCTELIHIGGASKGEYGYGVSKVFRYDTLTHELVETITEDKPGSRKLNLERHETIYQKYGYNLNTKYSPYWLAAKYSHCPQNWTDRT